MSNLTTILSSMSSAFNNSEKNQVVSLTEDSTLKWRGLLNNTYASKESKHMRGGRSEKSSSTENSSSVSDTTAESSSNKKVDVAKETISKAEQKQENNTSVNVNVDHLDAKKSENSTKFVENTENNLEKNDEISAVNTSNNEMISISITDKTSDKITTTGNGSSTNDKKSNKGTKATRIVTDVKSDRSLRSKGNVQVSNEEKIESEEVKSEISPTTINEEKTTPLRRGRGRKKKTPEIEPVKDESSISNISPVKTNDDQIALKKDTDEEKPRIVVTIRQNRSTNPVVSSTEVKPKSESDDKNIRKKGRRGRPLIKKLGQEKPSVLTRSTRKDDNSSSRPVRRIRPTAKILASDELREGFVQQNCARLNITNEEIQHMEEQNANESANNIETKRQTRDNKRRTRDDVKNEKNTETVQSAKKSSSPTNSVDSLELKRSLSFSDTSSSSKVSYMSNIPCRPLPMKCPDPQELLREIRNAKLAFPKSPEGNKKLNKKQHKRLIKTKNKYFYALGLKRNRRDGNKDASDSEDISDENEEFVPARKVVSVGKPGVTLRLRNFRKEEQTSGKRRSPDSDQAISISHQTPNKKRKPKEPEITRHEIPEMQNPKLTPTLVPVSMSTPIGPTSTSSSMTITSTSKQMLVLPATQPNTTANVSDVIDVDDLNLICLCIQPSKYFLQRTAAISHCCAIDEVEGQKIGCTNEVHGDLLQLLRPSVRTSYMVLCESHKKRLVSHNCCAGCGVFLTQGIFSLCPNRHFFHRDCTMKYILNAPYDPNCTDFTGPTLAFKCPHCGIDVPDSSFRVTMKCENVPVFFTNQKHHVHRAKMTITNKPPISANSFLLNIEHLIPATVLEIIRSASGKLKTQPPKVFTARDFCNAIYNNNGNIEKVAEIIASGFDVTKSFKEFHNGTCLHLVSSFGNVTILYMILCRLTSKDFINVLDKERRTAVMCAIMGRKNDILKILVQFGADVTLKGPEGMTALHLAAKTGNFSAAQIILDYYRQNGSVSKTETFLNMTDNGQWTALVWAAENGHAEIVSYFISLGADVNICDFHNNTVLHWAALSGKIDTIYPLMLPNTLYNTQNINGDTALHIACRQGNTRICLVLVANGANLYTRNDAGEIPLDCVPDDNSQCACVLQFNMEMRSLGNYKERKVLCHDISNGREMYPVQMVQRLGNEETMIMSDFKYITKNIILQNSVQIDMRISQMRVCSCSDSCVTENCQCGQISIQNWYNTDGQLISDFNYEDPAMIFECNDICGCNVSQCKNRVVQRGIKVPLQVFECEDTVKGFGVRALVKVSKGAFIAEYVGEILTDAEADRRTDDSFFFDLGASEHCIDAKFYGNISRFFNHSCEANVVPIRVYFDHQDIRFPKIAFFASRDIEQEEELTFDYGTKFWLAKYKQFTCHCKSTKCRYSTTTILKTLQEYNQRNANN